MPKDPRADWPDWARKHFPELEDSTGWREWRPLRTKHALAMHVLCVAKTREDMAGLWCAYCHAVPGINHENEMDYVLAYGDKLSEEIALALFPGFKGLPYAR